MKNNTENTENICKCNKNNDLQNKGIFSPIRVTNINHARRLLSKVLYEYQKGNINADYAKTLNYLLTSFVNICKVENEILSTEFQKINEFLDKNMQDFSNDELELVTKGNCNGAIQSYKKRIFDGREQDLS
jgi:hypothetical protein